MNKEEIDKLQSQIRGKVDVPELLPMLIRAGIDEVRYIHPASRLSDTNNVPATCCVLLRGGQRIADHFSILHPKDQFCRRTGRAVALRKAVRGLDIKHRRNGKSK